MNKEHPILMSGDMVRAILEDRKTQTRRIIKKPVDERFRYENDSWVLDDEKQLSGTFEAVLADLKKANIKCPYGRVGDRLWVRETFFEVYGDDFNPTGKFIYRATHEGYVNVLDEDGGIKVNKDGSDALPWKPSIHMPRCASRILLEITDIRVERLQDISEEDAIEEGILFNGDYDLWWDYQHEQWSCLDPIDSFKSLICKINGPKTWAENPWVWVIEFKTIEVKGDSHDES